MALTYDRRIRPGLESVLERGGVAHSLVELHLSDPDRVDLHLRAYPGQARNWVTLYCGLTKPLDLIETNGRYRLKTHPTWRVHGPDVPWNIPLDATELQQDWPKVESYLDLVLPEIEGSRWFGKEGAVQTAVTRLTHEGMTVFDREACPSFTDTPEKKLVMEHEAELLKAGLTSDEKWWVLPKLGEECDAVALDEQGRFLAIEVKPASAGAKSIAFAPLQAAYYARLFMRWAASDPMHSDCIDGLIAQRARLGLSPEGATQTARPMPVVPIVVIGGGQPSIEVLRRCRAVRSRLLDVGLVEELPLWSLEDGVLHDLTG